MKFYIASSLRNVDNVRSVAGVLKSRGFIQTYDSTTHTNVDSISKLREIGHEEVSGVLDTDVVIILMPCGERQSCGVRNRSRNKKENILILLNT